MTPDEIFPHAHQVSRETRSLVKSHLPVVIWLTGLSGSGKSTIANALEMRLVRDFKAHTYLLDGDNIRIGLNAGLGFSEIDRKENIRRVGEVAKLMYDAGLIVITAFISPFAADRELVRELLPLGSFWEVYVSCPLEICAQRDPKGLYQKANSGKIASFTGLSSPYEPPQNPELELPTDQLALDDCVDKLLRLLVEKKILTP